VVSRVDLTPRRTVAWAVPPLGSFKDIVVS
jgi:hypothetical protein